MSDIDYSPVLIAIADIKYDLGVKIAEIMQIMENVTQVQLEQQTILNELITTQSQIISTGEGEGTGATKAKDIKISMGGGSRYWARLPFMSPTSMARFGFRQAAIMAGIPYGGLLVSAGFGLYEKIMKDIAEQAAIDAIKQYDKEQMAERKLLVEDTVRRLENIRRESYRSVVP